MQSYYNNPYNNYGYQNYQNYAPQPKLNTNSIFAFVNGVEEARAFIVSPNQTVYLLDNNSSHLFIKKADMQGRYLMEDYILTKAEQENTDFVKKSDFESLQQQILALTQAVNSITSTKEN